MNPIAPIPFGLTYPIFQAPTGSIAGPELAAAVAIAGGMGAMGATRHTPEMAAANVRAVRAQTDKPFQVNFVLHFPPAALDAVLDAGVPVVTFSWGDAKPYVPRVKAAGALTGIQVTNTDGARRALDLGADFLICQGTEAGGHIQASLALREILPHIVEAANGVPVIAAGGIGDGVGIAQALSLGAVGAILGTRFVATQESRAHAIYKQQLIAVSGEADTALTVCFDGSWPYALHRVLRNSTLENWEADGCPAVGQRPGEGDTVAQMANGAPILRYEDTAPRAGMTGGIDEMCLYAGTSCSVINDIPAAGELVERLWAECQTAMQA